MDWIINIVMLVAGFFLDRLWDWWKKKRAGLTGQAHSIIAKLGNSIQSFDGFYFLSSTPTENYKIVKHVYENAAGDVIGTCFRENPADYGERDLARLLPPGASFARLTTDRVCPATDLDTARHALGDLVTNSRVVSVPSSEFFTSIDGVFTELSDGTHIAFVTFPKVAEKRNRGVVFYGHVARAFYTYYRDLRDAHAEPKSP